MNNDKKRLYIFTAIFVAVLLLACFVSSKSAQLYALAVFSVISAVGICFLLKKRSIYSLHKRQAALILTALAICSVAVYFITGAKFGYYRVQVSYASVWLYILPIVVAVIGTEVVRGVFLAQKSRAIGIVSFFTCVTVDVLILANVRALSSFENFIDTLMLCVLPCVASNFLYHRVSDRFGPVAVVPYKLILFLYPYVFSVRPQIPEALLAFARIAIPIGIFFFIGLLYKTRSRYKVSDSVTSKAKKRLYTGATVAAVALAIAFVMLVSGVLPYKMIVIVTGSMTGTIDKGDAVIYRTYDGQTLQTDDVIVFEKDGALIVHRIVDITNRDGEIRYSTKGDANDSVDSGYITDGQIVGLVKLKIINMGYPSIWIRSLFK